MEKDIGRPMTNFNKNPYNIMWSPTYRDTRKIENIKKNSMVLVIFPDTAEDKFYEIEGSAEFEDPEVVRTKWGWWCLY